MRLDESKIRQIVRQTIAQRLSEAVGQIEVTNQLVSAIRDAVDQEMAEAQKNPAAYGAAKVATWLLNAVKDTAENTQYGGYSALSANIQSGRSVDEIGKQLADAASSDLETSKRQYKVQPNEKKVMEEFGVRLATVAKGAIEKYQATRSGAQKSGSAGKQMKTWDDYIRLSSDGNKARDVRAAFTEYVGRGKGGAGHGDDSFGAFVRWYNSAKRANGGKDFGLDAAISMLSPKQKSGSAGSNQVAESRRRLNEDTSYNLIDLIKDVCSEFNDQYSSKNLRARPGKYAGQACIVVGGYGDDSVVGGAFSDVSSLEEKIDDIIDQKQEAAMPRGVPRKALDPVVVSARTDGSVKVQVKKSGKELTTPLVDSKPGNLNRAADYSLYAVKIYERPVSKAPAKAPEKVTQPAPAPAKR